MDIAIAVLLLIWGYSSVVEHPAAIRQVLGSTPSVPCFMRQKTNSAVLLLLLFVKLEMSGIEPEAF